MRPTAGETGNGMVLLVYESIWKDLKEFLIRDLSNIRANEINMLH